MPLSAFWAIPKLRVRIAVSQLLTIKALHRMNGRTLEETVAARSQGKSPTVVELLKTLEPLGYADRFTFRNGQLVNVEKQRPYDKASLSVDGVFRFEGPSDPENLSIVYAVSTHDGRRGVVIDAYGVYANRSLEEFMAGVRENR